MHKNQIARRNRLITVLLSVSAYLILSWHSAFAGDALTLKDVLARILRSNPEIKSSERSFKAANARIWQAASLEDPLVEMEYDKLFADRMLTGEPMKTYALSQEVPFPTKLFLRAKIAAKQAKTAYEGYKAKERDLLSRGKSGYSELILIYKSIEIMKEQKGLLEQFSASATSRYAAAKGSQADALKAQVELARVDSQLIMLEQKRLTAQARLNVLMNRDPKEEIGPPSIEEPVNFTRSLEDLYAAARVNNPEIKAYRYAIERGQAAYDLSLNEFMPDFMIKFKQMVNRDRVDENAWSGMLGVTIPLWFFQKQAFGVKEMKEELEMARAEYKAKENNVLFDIRDAYARVEANRKIAELYETAFIPQAEETLKTSLRGYESDKTDFLTLLDSQRMLTEFKLDHYRAILDLRVALADLERAAGADINEALQRGAYEKK